MTKYQSKNQTRESARQPNNLSRQGGSVRKVIEARDTFLEIAEFFHTVAHQEELTISKGMTIPELARNVGTHSPRSLGRAVVRSTSVRPSSSRKGQPLLTIVYEVPRRGQGVVEFKKCIEVGTTGGTVSGKLYVCIECSIRKLRCVITIVVTGTIVIG